MWLRPGSLTIADQAVSSIGNFAASAIVASLATMSQFDSYAFAFLVYILVLGFFRGYFGDSTLSVASQRAVSHQFNEANLRCLPISAMCASLLCTPTLCVLLIGGWEVGPFLLWLVACLPFLILQDTGRYCAFAMNRPEVALASDCAWTALVIGAGIVAKASHTPAIVLFGVWVISGSVVGLLAATYLWFHSKTGVKTAAWFADHARCGVAFSLEFATGGAIGQAVVFLLAAVIGVGALGDIRGGQILCAPLNVVFVGLTVISALHVGRLTISGARSIWHYQVRVSIATSLLSVLIAGAICLCPPDVGTLLLGDNWQRSQETGVLLAVGMLGTGVAAVGAGALRGVGAAKLSLIARLCGAPAIVTFALIGASVGGVLGACVGIAAGNLVTGAAYLVAIRHAISQQPSPRHSTVQHARLRPSPRTG